MDRDCQIEDIPLSKPTGSENLRPEGIFGRAVVASFSLISRLVFNRPGSVFLDNARCRFQQNFGFSRLKQARTTQMSRAVRRYG